MTPLADSIRARASALGVRSAADVDKAKQIAGELHVDVKVVQKELAAFFAGTTNTKLKELVPVAQLGGKGASALDLLSTSKSMASGKRWDPVSRLPDALRERLSPADTKMIKDAIGVLQKGVKEQKLEFIPVFGYLSLRTNNFAELGKKSQDDVKAGVDVVNAQLPGFDIDVIASSVYRGTPEHPGAVAGLSKKENGDTPGVVLKVPISRAEELLAVLLARELFAESDLKDGEGGRSNSMYAPIVETVRLEDGKEVKALVFATNDAGDKAVDRPEVFGDGKGLTLERMAYLFAGQGGFVRDDGKTFGGPSVDYWQKSYLEARKAAGQPVDPKIAAAIELSKLMPQAEVVDKILARTDRDAKLMQEALAVLFPGVSTPLSIRRDQKDELKGLVRQKQGTRGEDAEELLLKKAKELERAGRIKLE